MIEALKKQLNGKDEMITRYQDSLSEIQAENDKEREVN